MSNASRIRDWLATQDGPRNAAEIRAGTGLTRHQVNAAVHDMVIAGIMDRTGNPYVYSLGRDPAPRKALPPDERRARVLERHKKWRQNNRPPGQLPLDERRALIRAQSAQRKQEAAVAKTERKRQADTRLTTQATREQSAAKRLQPKLAALAKSAERRSAKEQPSCQKREAQRKAPAMTSDDFIRAGGEVERIAAGVVSEAGRLKRIGGEGHRALNRESWARRASA